MNLLLKYEDTVWGAMCFASGFLHTGTSSAVCRRFMAGWQGHWSIPWPSPLRMLYSSGQKGYSTWPCRARSCLSSSPGSSSVAPVLGQQRASMMPRPRVSLLPPTVKDQSSPRDSFPEWCWTMCHQIWAAHPQYLEITCPLVVGWGNRTSFGSSQLQD